MLTEKKNKPAGLVIHSDGRTKDYTVATWMLEQYPESKEVGEPSVLKSGDTISRPGIVHRLDRETSGVLMLVKNQHTYFNYIDYQYAFYNIPNLKI